MEIARQRTQSHTKSSNHTKSYTCTLTQIHCRANSHTFTPVPPFPIDRAKFLCLLEVHLSASSAAITISGRVILLHSASFSPSSSSPSSSALLITLISLCIVAVNWHCAWRALRCEADRAGQYELGLLLHPLHLLLLPLQLTAGFNVRVTQVCAHLLRLCLRRCRCVCVPLLMNENYKDALPCSSLCHRFAFNDTRTGYLLT